MSDRSKEEKVDFWAFCAKKIEANGGSRKKSLQKQVEKYQEWWEDANQVSFHKVWLFLDLNFCWKRLSVFVPW